MNVVCDNKLFKERQFYIGSKKINLCLFPTKKIINIYHYPTPKEYKELKKLRPNHIVQIWIKLSELESKNFKKYNIYSFGLIRNDFYLILRDKTTLYNNFFSLQGMICNYYRKSFVGRNTIIIPEELIVKFREMINHHNEMSGIVKYEPILVNDHFSWKLLNTKLKQISEGISDKVDSVYDKITFHTHPIPTYKKIKTKVAWPSLDDYLVIHDICKYRDDPIYHLVIAKEGIYLIYFRNKVKMSKEWVEENLNIPYIYSISYFLKTINKNKHIKTYFLKWSPKMIFEL